jgi:hypothetical protein
MKRLAPWVLCATGILALWLLIPRFNTSQPLGIRLTRAQASDLADREARRIGIPVDGSFATLTWVSSPLLDQELEKKPNLRKRAAQDPVIGPRLGGYRKVYYRTGLEKFPPYGQVVVSDRTGEVLMARRRYRNEEVGPRLTEEQARPIAEAFVRSRTIPGAPSPTFEDARPTMQRNRTDWMFRYRVPTDFPTGAVVPYLWVHVSGEKAAGWELAEEYADGRQFRRDDAGEVAGLFLRYGVMYSLLLLLLIIFLKKYHAGEVGVSTASLLFFACIALSLIFNTVIGAASSEGNQMGGTDARQTAIIVMGFKFLFFDIPAAVLIFFGWAVGESYARERWGERLASFDAVLRRDPLNATTGRSLLHGLLLAPSVTAAALVVGLIPVVAGVAHPTRGAGTDLMVRLGGPLSAVVSAALDALGFAVLAVLFVLAAAFRRRVFAVGVIVAIAFGAIAAVAEVPIDPVLPRMVFGFGAAAAVVAVFLAFDLLTAAVALFGGAVLAYSLPLLSVAEGSLFTQTLVWVSLPPALLLVFALGALLTKREVVYTYEDLAPHVKRIIERERVKAEIDAANRIQAALLPLDTPHLAGVSVASHYRAATEIGGDYFDFLPQRNGDIGIAFGDVAGHGLTSGIVMAMAKSALLVQIGTDPSPRTVMSVLNDIVMKTAPKRMMMTFFFGLLDPKQQILRFSSAGHLDPYVFRANARHLEPLSSWGFPLGVRRRDPFREHTVEFSAGDRLILYSDGLIEAVDDDGEPFGFERFEKTLLESGHLGAEDIKKALLSSVKKFTRNRPPEDDQTLVVVEFEEAVADVLPRRAVGAAFSDAVN